MGDTLEYLEANGDEPGGCVCTLGYECSECGREYQTEGHARRHVLAKHKRGYIKENQTTGDEDWYYKIEVPRKHNKH